MPRLSGKTAFITGGGTGIGRACALVFASEGAQVAIAGRKKEPLDGVAKEIQAAGGRALAIECDVVDGQAVQSAIATVARQFNGLHIVVNNAGAIVVGSVEDTTDKDWNLVMATNLTGTFIVSRAAIPVLRQARGGSIVNIGSYLGIAGRRQRAAYCAAKAGVMGLTRAMALDHAQDKIRVNCICPAMIETEMASRSLSKAADPEAARKQRIAEIPLGRLGKPEDVALMAVYLASEESSWVTGVSLPLDGGQTAY
ncbi:MAG TPA: SDR family NAD(P)-dependent oxidoreductase [Candidatus Binatus sp.]|jgi:NAD(P)-dependent dehydrogenase (short-subunit alcohol dehydrogenase family)|nr:SDR family NAD(P)-dependent oxidoreductase [Candidatus Binatus sp.]